MIPTENNGWSEWGRHVLKTLEENVDAIKGLTEEISALKVSVGKLQTQAAMWGVAAGIVSAAVIKVVLH